MEDYYKLRKKLDYSKNMKINDVRINEIDDIEQINIDTNLPKLMRIMNYIEKAKNPYMMNVNGTKVKFEFTNNGLNINKCLENIFIK